MCGRFVSASPPDELARYFGAVPTETALEDNYNVAPTNPVYAVRADHGHRALVLLRWGLVPPWADDVKIGSRMINARAETIASKPAFRRAFQRRRCLVPADAFYEWKKIPGQKAKQPYAIVRADGDPLVFAGIWERWAPKDAEGRWIDDERLETCSIITTAANPTMAEVHDRMPAMIPAARWDDWLDPDSEPSSLTELLVPAPDDLLRLHKISTAVNNVRNNGPRLLDPVDDPVDGAPSAPRTGRT